jgi:ATP-dependent DNA helicase RecG
MLHLGLARKDQSGNLRPIRAAVLLFAEEPSGLLAGKVAIRIFHYRGTRTETDPKTNLLKTPITVSGPLIRQINKSKDIVINELASGIQMDPSDSRLFINIPSELLTKQLQMP